MRFSFRGWQKSIGKYAKRWWFGPLVGFLSALDAYVVVVPNEPIIVAAATARPKCWLSIGVWATLGSAVGAASVAWLVSLGSDWVLGHFHGEHSHTWGTVLKTVRQHGLWGLALISLSPLPQHAAVIVAGLVRMPVWEVLLAVTLGRAPKYIGCAYLAAKAPKKLEQWHIVKKSA